MSIDGIITTLVTLIIGLLPYLIHLLNEWRHRGDQIYKFMYIKVYYLTPKLEGKKPVYEQYIDRLTKKIGVYDEFHSYRLSIFRKKQKDFRFVDRSSGIVDAQIIHPWQSLYFADKGAAKVDGVLEQNIDQESSIFFTKTIYYNGIQVGNEDFGMRMEGNTQEARLMVDFSGIPGFESFIKGTPKGIHISSSNNNDSSHSKSNKASNKHEEAIGVIAEQPGIYLLHRKDLKKGDVIRMDFKLDWQTIEKQAILQFNQN